MKVLIIGNIPEDKLSVKSGVESAILNLLEGLSYFDSAKVVLVSFNHNIKRAYKTKYLNNITIHYYPEKGFIELFSILFYERKIVKQTIVDFKPDVIHFQGSGPHLLSLIGINKSNVILTLHGIIKEEFKYQINLKNKIKFLFKSLVDNYYLSRFKNFIFISKYNCDQVSLKVNKSTIIPNAINRKLFNLPSNSKSYNKLIYIGAINKRKGLLILLKALVELQNININYELEVIGGSKELKYKKLVEDYVNQNQLNSVVKFHGWVSQNNIGDYLSKSSVFVLPSQQESLPISIAEAMATKNVVIASNVGGISEMISDKESGFLFEKGNTLQLIAILKELYNNSHEIERIAGKAVIAAKNNYDPQVVARRSLEYYETVVLSTKDI